MNSRENIFRIIKERKLGLTDNLVDLFYIINKIKNIIVKNVDLKNKP